MTRFRFCVASAFPMLTLATALSAQDSTPPSAPQPEEAAVPTPIALEETTLPSTASQLAAPEPLNRDEVLLWRLQGGGEVVGELVKETPTGYFIDIGPTIVEVPRGALLEKLKVSDLTDETGKAQGTLDPTTQAIVERSHRDSGEMLSQNDILDNVKRGVVLVSNPAGLGTGWLINKEGQLITNHHVVGSEPYQTVTLFVKNGTQWERRKIDNCKVEAMSTLLDIALVQLDMDKVRDQKLELYPLEIDEPNTLSSGDVVYAVGNPGMGRMVLEHTISEGIVSSLQRNFNDVIYLQTSAAVNPGNSGGPLINQRGEVVGLVTLKATFQEGVAFALPVEYVHQFLRHLKGYALDDNNNSKGYRYHRPQ